MLQLNSLENISKKRKRIGRGGDKGGTSGRGHKGQRARAGGKARASGSGFEGGQMPLSRRLPKRGFVNSFAKPLAIVNLVDLENRFDAETVIDLNSLKAAGLVKGKSFNRVKILGSGELTKKFIVIADQFSKSAEKAIVTSGGEARVIS